MKPRVIWRNKLNRYFGRHWAPEVVCFHLYFVTVILPRRLWPHKTDGYRTCSACGKVKWMEGARGSRIVCHSCSDALNAVAWHTKQPPYWGERVKTLIEERFGK